jgi:CRP/FNR family transcriptional regulator, dissimilatory nitrate respiration regulator
MSRIRYFLFMRTVSCDLYLKSVALKTCRGFRELPADGMRELAALCEMREYEAGETLFLHGAKAAGFFVLVSGGILVYRTASDGKRQILHLFEESGEMCGEVPVFEGSLYPASAECQGTTRALYLRRSDFLAVTRRRPEILLAMLANLSRRLRHFVDLIDDLALKDVAARLARHLTELATQAGDVNVCELATGKALLADRIGTVAETLSRTLRKFQEQGLIAVSGRTITLLDRNALARLAGEPDFTEEPVRYRP